MVHNQKGSSTVERRRWELNRKWGVKKRLHDVKRNPWFFFFFFFFLVKTGCGDPGQVQNAQRTVVTSFNINGVVTYTCNSGYQIIGQGGQATTSAQITCQATRRWTPLPVCSPESAQQGEINTLKVAEWSNKRQVGTNRCAHCCLIRKICDHLSRYRPPTKFMKTLMDIYIKEKATRLTIQNGYIPLLSINCLLLHSWFYWSKTNRNVTHVELSVFSFNPGKIQQWML